MRKNFLAALLITGILAITSSTMADKPPWAGGDKNGNKHQKSDNYQSNERNDRHSDDRNRDQKNEQNYRNSDDGHRNQHNEKNYRYTDDRDRKGHDGKGRRHFNEHNRIVINNYYTQEYRRGHCPPGLVRRDNSCRPRGHDRNWHVGRQLPREVIFYDIPPQVTVLLGPPPSHHRYVRVAGDILLITIGTGMVVDAIQDLNGL